MRYLILLTLLFPFAAMAVVNPNQYLIIDMNKLKEKREEFKYMHVTGQALGSEDKDGQLRMYIRGCGKIIIPKNEKGEIPKAGQTITATLKTQCSISDWK